MGRNWAVAAVCFATLGVSAQTLSPREIFYGQDRPESKTVSKAKTAPSPHLRQKLAKTNEGVSEGVSERAAASGAVADSSTPRMSPVPATYTTTGSTPQHSLGLRYTILQRQPNGGYVATDPDASFVSGDRIRLMVEANDTAYLYVVTQGSSHVWKMLYPTSDMPAGSNLLRKGREYAVPDGSVFSFDSRAGTEKLFVVLSRDPVPDLESFIRSLSNSEPERPRQPETMLTQNIQDSLVQRLRTAYSRDLLIEKVDDGASSASEPAGSSQRESGRAPATVEKAVYVVNPTSQGRVVADIALRHE